MPEPLKNIYSETFIDSFSAELKNYCQSLQIACFKKDIFDDSWDDKELKDRMHHIAAVLGRHLPQDFQKALAVLKPFGEKVEGFEYMFIPDFVELHGLNHYSVSVRALEHFTACASSEFAVRPFIVKYGDRMMKQMLRWADSRNYHVRRLASEGCRPRLPWATSLPEFKKDPTPILPILEKLKNDPSEYVRRSVANNLNDISRDNPDVLLEIVKRWRGQNAQTDWIVKHASRGLLRNANAKALSLFGHKQPSHVALKQLKAEKIVMQGEKLTFSFALDSGRKKLGKLRIEYAIDFMKANGKQARKVFKISESDYSEKFKEISRAHSFRKITTRKYYSGSHVLAIIVNGQEIGRRRFELS